MVSLRICQDRKPKRFFKMDANVCWMKNPFDILCSVDPDTRAEDVLRIIRDGVAPYPCEQRVDRMKWGAREMIKVLESEGTSESFKIAHALWKRARRTYPDYITDSDEPKAA